MDFGRKVGSKIDRYGSTLAERSVAIKEASKVASQVLKEPPKREQPERAGKSFRSTSVAGSKFGTSFKQK